MLNFGDLSKAQRAMLDLLWVDGQAKRAASIDTALTVDGKSRQTAENLEVKGFVVVCRSQSSWRPRVYLTDAGIRLMRGVTAQRVNSSRYGRFHRSS